MSEAQPSQGALIAAHLQRVEIALLARVLATTLAAALPPSRIEVERIRTATDVLRRRPGQAIGITIHAADTELSFRAPDVGTTQATIKHVVRGIVLSTKQVDTATWLQRLGDIMDHEASLDTQASDALQRFINERT